MDQSGNVTNISAIYRKAMTEDKTIDSLTVDGIYAYLYARFGIVKVNMQRAEISDTYTKNHPEYPTNLPASNINANWADYIDVVKTLKPGGPVYNHFNYMLFTDRLYTTGGGWRDGGEFSRPGCAQILASDGEWEIFHNVKPLMGSTFLDATCIAKVPKNSQHYFVATCGTGLYEFLNGEMVMNYTEGNSPLNSSIAGNNDYVRVDGLIFDTEGKLWMSCSSRSSEKNTLLTLDIDTKEWTTYNDNELYYNGTRLDRKSVV